MSTTPADWSRWPNFTPAEMGCRHCGRAVFHPGFMDQLQRLRDLVGVALPVTSGARCKLHNDRPAAEGGASGHTRSLHVFDHAQHPGQRGALAVDVAVSDGTLRGILFATAWALGWSIGWNAKKGFLHLDRRDFVGLPQTSFDY